MIPQPKTSDTIKRTFLHKLVPFLWPKPEFDNAVTAVPFERLGHRDEVREFLPTYNYYGDFINSAHKFYQNCPINGNRIDIGIKGSLRRDDALKLYELAYFSDGSILELGCNHGLSTAIMAGAIRDAGGDVTLTTVDLVEKYVNRTRNTLSTLGLSDYVQVNCSDAIRFCGELLASGHKFALAFVDHSHEYQLVFDATTRVAELLTPGGFCLFHDFHDYRNVDTDNEAYGVAQGVIDGLNGKPFQFYGIFGCAALYRKECRAR